MTSGRRLLTEGFVALVVALALVVLAAVATRGSKLPDGRPSTYSDAPLGFRALFLLLEDVGVAPTRLHRSPGPADDTAQTIVIAAPTWPMSEPEIDAALDWAAAGGRLVVLEAKDIQGSDGVAATPRDAGPFFARFARTAAATSRGTSAKVDHAPLRQGVETIRWRPVLHLAPLEDPPAPDPRAGAPSILATTGDEPLVEEIPFGRGSVVLVADESFLTNLGLREADNAILAVNLVTGDPARPVAFDEFHHGAAEGGSRLTLAAHLVRLTTDSWGGRAILVAALAFLVHLAGGMIRFGAPLPERPSPRRSLAEHAAALGRLLERSRSPDAALRALLAGASRTCAPRAGVRRSAGDAALEAALRTSPADGAAELADAVAEARAATKTRTDPALFATIAARLAAARRRFLHG